MENYRKNIGAIIILLLSTIFVQNANAIELTTEVESTGTTFPITDLYCKYNDNYSTTRASNCINPHDEVGIITQLRPVQKISIKEGYYYRTYLTIKSTLGDPQIFYQMDYDTTNYNLISFKEVSYDKLHNDYKNICTTSSCSAASPYSYFREINSPYSKIYEVVLRAKTTGDQYFTLGDGIHGFIWWELVINSHTTGNAYVGIIPIEEFKKSGGTAEAEEKTEEASNEGETNSQQANTDNQTASQNVIGVISNIIGAFGTSAGNCTLPGNLGNLNVGNINLCQGKPPEIASIINIVGSIVIVYACYRVARNIFRIWITITAFAQGNSKGGN